MFYVYELIDPRNHLTFYVGKGKGARVGAHEKEARRGASSEKCVRIREIEASGEKVIQRIVASFRDEQDAYDAEAALIEQYGLENLTNVARGGGTPRGAPTIYQDRLRVSAAAYFLWRTHGKNIDCVSVHGQVFNLRPVIEDWLNKAKEVASRRGVEWANKISARYNVVFHP